MKKTYITPLIKSINVHLEESLSASSTSFTTGENGNEPIVEDWTEETITNDLEF